MLDQCRTFRGYFRILVCEKRGSVLVARENRDMMMRNLSAVLIQGLFMFEYSIAMTNRSIRGAKIPLENSLERLKKVYPAQMGVVLTVENGDVYCPPSAH